MKEPEEKVQRAAQRGSAGDGAETLRAWARKPEARAQMQRVLDELALSWGERGSLNSGVKVRFFVCLVTSCCLIVTSLSSKADSGVFHNL